MVRFLKIRDVKSPIREYGNAGIDIFVPNFNSDFLNDLKEKNKNLNIDETGIVLNTNEDVLIPMGLKTLFEPNISLECNNKSGIATKRKLIVGACIIDSSYQGEIHAHIINIGKNTQKICFGDKIIQLVPKLIDTTDHITYDNIDESTFFNNVVTSRGSNGFGSTGVS